MSLFGGPNYLNSQVFKVDIKFQPPPNNVFGMASCYQGMGMNGFMPLNLQVTLETWDKDGIRSQIISHQTTSLENLMQGGLTFTGN